MPSLSKIFFYLSATRCTQLHSLLRVAMSSGTWLAQKPPDSSGWTAYTMNRAWWHHEVASCPYENDSTSAQSLWGQTTSGWSVSCSLDPSCWGNPSSHWPAATYMCVCVCVKESHMKMCKQAKIQILWYDRNLMSSLRVMLRAIIEQIFATTRELMKVQNIYHFPLVEHTQECKHTRVCARTLPQLHLCVVSVWVCVGVCVQTLASI